jgi:hypothetical protein
MSTVKAPIVASLDYFAPVSPTSKNGTRWIDHTSVRSRARDARSACAANWSGGWPALRKLGWTIEKVDVVPHQEPVS